MNGVVRPKQNDRNNLGIKLSLGSLTSCRVIKAERYRGGYEDES